RPPPQPARRQHRPFPPLIVSRATVRAGPCLGLERRTPRAKEERVMRNLLFICWLSVLAPQAARAGAVEDFLRTVLQASLPEDPTKHITIPGPVPLGPIPVAFRDIDIARDGGRFTATAQA